MPSGASGGPPSRWRSTPRITGAPPASLAELVPTYLPVVPIDPWDGKPLRYAAGPPARVWSVGRDGTDDGGKHAADPDDESQPGDFAITIQSPR